MPPGGGGYKYCPNAQYTYNYGTSDKHHNAFTKCAIKSYVRFKRFEKRGFTHS